MSVDEWSYFVYGSRIVWAGPSADVDADLMAALSRCHRITGCADAADRVQAFLRAHAEWVAAHGETPAGMGWSVTFGRNAAGRTTVESGHLVPIPGYPIPARPLSAEAIVRALAAINDPTIADRDYAVNGRTSCGLCCSFSDAATGGTVPHRIECPWRLAREWVEKNPT